MEEQARKYHPKLVAVPNEDDAKQLKISLADTSVEVVSGSEGLSMVAADSDVDMVLSAIVGFAGLVPTMQAIKCGKDIALANKETLVTAGNLFMEAIAKNNVRLLPVDSELLQYFKVCLPEITER